MAKFKMDVLVPTGQVVTARVSAAGATSAIAEKNKGKFYRLVADSRYGMCTVGQQIEGVLIAVEPATRDGYPIGSVQTGGRVAAICDGDQATPGTGSIAVGDLVVCGTVVADGTELTSTTGPKVCKATSQSPGLFNWRVVSLGNNGAVGDTCIIERV